MRYTIEISLDLVIKKILAESAWRAAHRNDVYTLSPDNAELLSVKIRHALNELLSRMAGYVIEWHYLPYAEENNITIVLEIEGIIDETIIRNSIIDALTFNVLLQFYGEQDNYYGTAWRKHRAHVMLLLCRSLVDNPLAEIHGNGYSST